MTSAVSGPDRQLSSAATLLVMPSECSTSPKASRGPRGHGSLMVGVPGRAPWREARLPWLRGVMARAEALDPLPPTSAPTHVGSDQACLAAPQMVFTRPVPCSPGAIMPFTRNGSGRSSTQTFCLGAASVQTNGGDLGVRNAGGLGSARAEVRRARPAMCSTRCTPSGSPCAPARRPGDVADGVGRARWSRHGRRWKR